MGIKKHTEGSIHIMDVITAFTGEATTEDGSTAIYQIDAAGKRIWDPNTDITPSAGTIDTSWQDRGIDWFTGRVKMTASGLTALTLAGEYATLQEVGYCHGITLDMNLETGEITSIGDTWRKLQALHKSLSVSLERYRFDTELDHVSDTNYILLKIFEDGSAGYWVKCLLGSQSLSKTFGNVDDVSRTFEVDTVIARIA